MEQEPVSLVHPWFTPFRLYIFRFLHQTTTIRYLNLMMKSCISFVSYIKPQLAQESYVSHFVVYLSFPTSNHNLYEGIQTIVGVVYLSFPTSNHNFTGLSAFSAVLYIFRFLHQTTTCIGTSAAGRRLYIFRFLHQTTTYDTRSIDLRCCISFVSYIKPQQYLFLIS